MSTRDDQEVLPHLVPLVLRDDEDIARLVRITRDTRNIGFPDFAPAWIGPLAQFFAQG